jgi:hypothetical protein
MLGRWDWDGRYATKDGAEGLVSQHLADRP